MTTMNGYTVEDILANENNIEWRLQNSRVSKQWKRLPMDRKTLRIGPTVLREFRYRAVLTVSEASALVGYLSDTSWDNAEHDRSKMSLQFQNRVSKVIRHYMDEGELKEFTWRNHKGNRAGTPAGKLRPPIRQETVRAADYPTYRSADLNAEFEAAYKKKPSRSWTVVSHALAALAGFGAGWLM